MGATLWREIDLLLQPRPNVQYNSVENLLYQNVSWVRLVFKNIVTNPSGDISTSQDTRARIEILGTDDIPVDSWDGRWSDSGWPQSYGDIPEKNKWKIIANDTAKLDIGGRPIGQAQFIGHYNRTPESPEPPRKALESGSYYVRVELWASNMRRKEFWFILQVPNTTQSDDTQQVKVTLIKKPNLHKKGFQH